MSSEVEVDDWRKVCKDNKSRSEHILQKEILTDCKFLVGRESDESATTIRGHKLILAVASPVFERMFYGSFDDEKSNEIRIPDIKHNIFRKMLDYIYFEKLELVTVEEAIELYSAANKYMLHNLPGQCIDYLIANFNRTKICKIYEFAVFFEEKVLMTKSADYMARNAAVVLKRRSLLDAKLTTLIALFERDPLNIDSELDLFQALNKYALANGYFDTKNDVENENKVVESEIGKKKQLREALKKIQFLCLKVDEFDIVAKSGLLTESEVLSILWNLVKPNITDCPLPEGFSNSRTPRCKICNFNWQFDNIKKN